MRMDFNLIKSRIVIDTERRRRRPGSTAAGAWVALLSAVAVLSAGPSAGGADGPRLGAEPAASGTAGGGAGATSASAHGAAAPAPATERSQATGPDSAVRVRRRVHAMGTRLTATAWADGRGAAVDALEAAVRSVEAMEERLSTWRDDTELAALNGAARGRPAPVGDTLFGLLEDVRRWREATDGAFDPAVGSLVEAWDLRGEGRVPDRDRLRRAREAAGLGCWRLHAGRRTVTPRCEGAWIDAGAFGKGAAFRAARRALSGAGVKAVLLDFGGQLLAVGRPPGEDAWRVGVAHPSDRDRSVAALALADRSAATTSASERFVVVEGETRGHVLDPRTGRPVPPWGSVTVVADDPLAADALSTGLFVMGPDRARAWAESRDDVAVLVLEEEDDGGLDAAWNDAMERHLVESPGPGDAAGHGESDDSGAGLPAGPRREPS